MLIPILLIIALLVVIFLAFGLLGVFGLGILAAMGAAVYFLAPVIWIVIAGCLGWIFLLFVRILNPTVYFAVREQFKDRR